MASIERLKFDGRYEGLRRIAEEASTKLRSYNEEVTTLEEAVKLARLCLERVTHLKSTLEELVSAGLSEVYQTNYIFRFAEDKDSGGTLKGLRPTLQKDGELFEDIREDCGNGPQAMMSFILQLSTVLLHPDCPKIIIADEPLGQIDRQAWVRFGEWLTDICEKTGLQVILITHRDSQFGAVYEVTQTKGVSTVQRIQ